METLILQFIGYDMMSNILGGIGSNLSALGDEGDKQGSRLSRMLDNVYKSSAALATVFSVVFLAFGGAAMYAVKTAAEYDQAVLRLYTHGGLMHDQLGAMNRGLLQLSSTTGVSAKDLADAAYFVTSYGIGVNNAAVALAVETVAAKTAAMTGSDLVTVQSTLSAMLVAGLLPMNNLTQAAGEYNAAISSGAITAEQLSSALHTGLIPAAVNAHVTFSNMAAAVDMLTRGGFSASTATTALRNELIRFVAGGPAAEKALQSIGLSHAAMAAELTKGDLLGTLQLLKSHLAGLSDAAAEGLIYKIFGGTRGTSAVVSMLHNLDQMPGIIDLINKGGSEFNNQWSAYIHSTAGQLSVLHQNFKDIVIVLGQALEPTFVAIMVPFNAFLQTAMAWIQANPQLVGEIFKTIMAIAGLGATIFGTIAIVGKIITLLESPFAAVMVAVVLALDLLVTHWSQVTGVIGPFVDTLVNGFGAIGKAWSGAFSSADTSGVTGTLSTLLSTLQGIGTTVGNLLSGAFGEFVKWLSATGVSAIQAFASSMHGMGLSIQQAAGWISGNLSGAFTDFVKFLQGSHIGDMLGSLVTFLAANIPTAARALMTVLGALVAAITPVFELFMHLGEFLYGVLQPIVSGLAGFLGGVLSGALGFVADHMHLVTEVVSILIARLIILKAVYVAGAIAFMGTMAISQMAGWVSAMGGMSGAIGAFGSKMATMVSGAGQSMWYWLIGMHGATITHTAAVEAGTIAQGAQIAETEVGVVQMDLFTAATEADTVAQDAHAVAMDASMGPVGWLVLGVTAVVTAYTMMSASADDAANKMKNAAQVAQDLANSFSNLTNNLGTSVDLLKVHADFIQNASKYWADVTQAATLSSVKVRQFGIDSQRTGQDASKAMIDLNNTFNSQPLLVQQVTDAVSVNKDEFAKWALALRAAGGDATTAISNMAASGDQYFGQLDAAMAQNAIDAQTAAKKVLNAYLDSIPNTVNTAMAALSSINDAYHAGSKDAAIAISQLSLPQQTIIRDMQTLSSITGLTFQQLQALGTDGTIKAGWYTLGNGVRIHLTGTLADALAEIDKIQGGFYALPDTLQAFATKAVADIGTVQDQQKALNLLIQEYKQGIIDANGVTLHTNWIPTFGVPGGTFTVPTTHLPRAGGGPVDQMTEYLVGEKGPETFRPRSAGTIIPNHALGGSGGGSNTQMAGHLQDLVTISRKQLAVMQQDSGAQPTPNNMNQLFYNAAAQAQIARRRGLRG